MLALFQILKGQQRRETRDQRSRRQKICRETKLASLLKYLCHQTLHYFMLSNKKKQTLVLHTQAQTLFRRKGFFAKLWANAAVTSSGYHLGELQRWQVPPLAAPALPGYGPAKATLCPADVKATADCAELEVRCHPKMPELWLAEHIRAPWWPTTARGTLLQHSQTTAALSYPDTTRIWTSIDAVIHFALSREHCCRKGHRLSPSAYKSGRDNAESYNITFSEPQSNNHKNLCSSSVHSTLWKALEANNERKPLEITEESQY